MSEVVEAARATIMQQLEAFKERTAAIDQRIPEIEQGMAALNAEKHALQDERRQIQTIQKSLDAASGAKGNGGQKATPAATTRRVSDEEVLAVVAAAPEPLSTREVGQALGVDARAIGQQLPRMAKAGMIGGDRDGWTAVSTEG